MNTHLTPDARTALLEEGKYGFTKKSVSKLIASGKLSEQAREAAQSFVRHVNAKRKARQDRRNQGRDPLAGRWLMDRLRTKAQKNAARRKLADSAKIAASWTAEELDDVLSWETRSDRTAAAMAATVSAVSRAAQSAGWTVEHVSEKNGGLSHYLRRGDALVRVSDHDLPDTAMREHNREQGRVGRWTDEVVTDGWRDHSAEDYLHRLEHGGFPGE